MDDDSMVLLQRFRQGDQDAATEMFDRYVARLIGLARQRMSDRLAQRVDAEDVVQSVYRSFFTKARDGRYELQKSGDLWRLLAGITVNKVLKKAEHHRQQKRSLAAEVAMPAEGGRFEGGRASADFIARDPAPDEAAALVEELEAVVSRLEPHERAILEFKLQGEDVEKIALAVGRSDRTVRRVLERVKETLESRLIGQGDDAAATRPDAP